MKNIVLNLQLFALTSNGVNATVASGSMGALNASCAYSRCCSPGYHREFQ